MVRFSPFKRIGLGFVLDSLHSIPMCMSKTSLQWISDIFPGHIIKYRKKKKENINIKKYKKKNRYVICLKKNPLTIIQFLNL